MVMSEHEKLLQVGRLAEEYSKLKGELNHFEEKLNHANRSYQYVSQSFTSLSLQNGILTVLNPRSGGDLKGLLNEHELHEVLQERDRLRAELEESRTRLRALAPHLV
jgi:hypothetical protein